MNNEIALRLRKLRDQSGWTVADMAERTGIPKRTLDKYMLRTGASLPGFDALCSLSKGLGVSLDWLVFGAEAASTGVELIVERATNDVVVMLIETILHYHQIGKLELVTNERVLNLTPEEWAADMSGRASDIAKGLIEKGATKAQLLEWQQARKDRVLELLQDRIDDLLRNEVNAKG